MTGSEVMNLVCKAETLFMIEMKRRVNVHWDVNWNSKTTFGECYQNGSYVEIKLSKWIYSRAGKDDVWNTICHELCHAYCPETEGHGAIWKRMAERMSVVCKTHITQYADSSKKSSIDYTGDGAVCTLVCNKCHEEFRYYRRGVVYRLEGRGCMCHCGSTDLTFTKLR